mmetsp:Transcript_42746/g.81748  ORF Transcript_42746/g.81748 Transcript_42746/m.81748 type:complete len:82 (+) Transcript_42746:1332-1577(+)
MGSTPQAAQEMPACTSGMDSSEDEEHADGAREGVDETDCDRARFCDPSGHPLQSPQKSFVHLRQFHRQRPAAFNFEPHVFT